MKPGCPGVTSCRALCLHRLDVEAYQLARAAEESAMEQGTALYPGDVAIWRAEHRMVTFKSWLLGKVGRV